MVFEVIQPGPPDPMNILKTAADTDTSPEKADLGVGIYRNEKGNYQELACVREAKTQLLQNDPGHDYECTTGNVEFLKHAAGVMFGLDSEPVAAGKLASVQTVSGTGAVHLAALFLSRFVKPLPTVYVGVPTWGNYKPMCELVGLPFQEYRQYDEENRTLDFASIISTVRSAPRGSVFIFQACCHNPTGMDPSRAQWDELRVAIQEMGHLPVFDAAYQGLGDGLDEDAYAVRSWAAEGIEMFVCQSFSKNFALYGERCGALHAFCPAGAGLAANVHDQLRCLIRWEFSSSPAYGARLVKGILGSQDLRPKWENELSAMRQRLQGLRATLFKLLTEQFNTPGNWQHICQEKGLFSYLRLSPAQCRALVENHIYLPGNGRINISGLNDTNLERVARTIDQVVRAAQ